MTRVPYLRCRFLPRFEPLEDRTLMSTCHVTNLSDTGIGGPRRGTGDLRFCIKVGNMLPGPDSIDFKVTGTIQLTGALPDLSTDMDIVGPGSSDLVVRRNTGGNYRIFTVAPGADVHISGLTMANGLVKNDVGGGLLNGGKLTLDNIRVVSNEASHTGVSGNVKGGGVYNEGTLTINQSSIASNTSLNHNTSGGIASAYGGGIYNTGTLTISDTTLSANSAEATATNSSNAYGYGGGIYNVGTLTVSETTLSQNLVYVLGGNDQAKEGQSRGGGIYNGGSTLIQDSTIANNTSSAGAYWADAYGGGIYTSGPLTVTNSTISGNEAGAGSGGDAEPCAYSGGIHNNSSTVTIDNSTIANNKAHTTLCGGYGIHVWGSAIITHSTIAGNSYGGIQIGGSLSLRNSIVAKNGIDISGTIASSGYNLIGNSSGGSGYVPERHSGRRSHARPARRQRRPDT